MDEIPRRRGRVPEYPRPVPDFDYHDLTVCDDTVVYDDAGSDVEGRAFKRLKTRQDWAETYLRGGEIRLLTAGLRGPFAGWRNPWKKSKKAGANGFRISAMEVPETTMRTGMLQEIAEIGATDDVPEIKRAALSKPDPPNPFDNKSINTKISLGEQAPSSTNRVEEWLKTSDVYSRKSKAHAGSSPTPLPRPMSRGKSPLRQLQSSLRRPGSRQTNEVKRTLVTSGFEPLATSSRPNSRQANEPRRNSSELLATSSRLNSHDANEPKRTLVNNGFEALASCSGTASSGPSFRSPKRAEAAILEQKRDSVHSLPPSTHQPAFEFRRPRHNEKKAPENQNPINQEPAERHELSNERDHFDAINLVKDLSSVPGPTLSAETSRTSTLHNLPSAQPAPPPQYQTEVSNAHSTNELLQELPTASRSGALQEQSNYDDKQSNEAAKEREFLPPREAAGAEDAAVGEKEQPTVETPVREPETQELIAGIKPFDFSTVKKPFDPPPLNSRKATSGKHTKRPSFAVDHPLSEDSQTSIKAGFKIKKPAVSNATGKTDKVVLLGEKPTGDESQDNPKDDTFGSLFSLNSVLSVQKTSPPKSILKSSNAVSSAPAATGDTTSTSVKQDAQPGQGVVAYGLLDDDPNFDLDAAMGDVGSFLGTWDPEEAARKVAGA
jgi:hypothetical protein